MAWHDAVDRLSNQAAAAAAEGVLARAAQELEYLETAVAVVLGFVGLKLGAGYFGYEVSTEASLAVIFLVLGAGVAASVLLPEEES